MYALDYILKPLKLTKSLTKSEKFPKLAGSCKSLPEKSGCFKKLKSIQKVTKSWNDQLKLTSSV